MISDNTLQTLKLKQKSEKMTLNKHL